MVPCCGSMQTDATLLANNMQHCWAQHVASVCMEPQQCWHLLRKVWNRSNFWATIPNNSIVVWPAKRSATMLHLFAWHHNNVGFVETSAQVLGALGIWERLTASRAIVFYTILFDVLNACRTKQIWVDSNMNCTRRMRMRRFNGALVSEDGGL